MNKYEVLLEELGINRKEEISNLLKNESYPEGYNPIPKFEKEMNRKTELIRLLKKKGFIENDLSKNNVVEIGGGTCSTGAAFAREANAVISFELEKVHCLYAKRCKEHFEIDNLGVLMGSIMDIAGHKLYSVKENVADTVVSHQGMFRYTILEMLDGITKLLRPGGEFIFLYPRFWTDPDQLNPTDTKLLNRALDNNSEWWDFNKEFEKELEKQDLKVEFKGVLEGYPTIPIGGDVILGSRIASSKEDYFSNPIDGISFGKTPITCNTVICTME